MTNYINKLVKNLKYSFRGILLCLKEPSFQLTLLYGVIFFVALWISHAGPIMKTVAVGVYGLMIGFELLNTAIEFICNKITQAQDEQIRNIKDISSAAVFVVVLINFFMLVSLFVHS